MTLNILEIYIAAEIDYSIIQYKNKPTALKCIIWFN